MKNLVTIIICFLFAIVLSCCDISVDNAETFENISAYAETMVSHTFEKEFVTKEILYDEQFKVFDILLIAKDEDIKVWCEVYGENIDKTRIVSIVASPLEEYGLVLKSDNELRRAQANALLVVSSISYTRNIAVVSDSYDNSNEEYKVKLITDSEKTFELVFNMNDGRMHLVNE